MSVDETIDAIYKMLESFIFPDNQFNMTFEVLYGPGRLEAYSVNLKITVDVMRVLSHSTTFDVHYLEKLTELSDWDYHHEVAKTIKKYLGISDPLYVNSYLDYQNTEELMKQKEDLKKEITWMSENSKLYDLKEIWVDVWMDREAFIIRLDVGGEISGDQDELELDIATSIANDSSYDYLSDVINMYGEISYWFE